MGTFVENVNYIAGIVTPELRTASEAIEQNQESIIIVGSSIDLINTVAEDVLPNIDEILLAGNNALIASNGASTATAKAAEALASANAALLSEQAAASSEGLIASHLIAEDNPHSVTKSQVGLSSVDNTSDVNKPLSIAATEALALKPNSTDLRKAIGNINSPLLDMPLKNSLAMKAGVGSATFTRASTATYIDRYGVLKTAAIDEPRFETEGYLNEGASTNLLTYSENFSVAQYAKENITVSSNTVATLDPYGTNLASAIFETAINAPHTLYSLQPLSLSAGTTYTESIFIKANGRTKGIIALVTEAFPSEQSIYFDLVAKTMTPRRGTIVSYKMEEMRNGWFRISISSTATANGSTQGLRIQAIATDTTLMYLGDITKGFYIFGAQLEALPFASSYIPTVASAVTRAGDVLSVAYQNNLPLSNKFTIASDANILGAIGYPRVFDIYKHSLLSVSDTGAVCVVASTASVNSYIAVPNTKLTSRFITISDQSAQMLYLNGILKKTDAYIGTLYDTGYLNIFIGSASGVQSFLYGHISNFRIYDQALTSQEAALA